jgi:CheY-like chemotaxis protein
MEKKKIVWLVDDEHDELFFRQRFRHQIRQGLLDIVDMSDVAKSLTILKAIDQNSGYLDLPTIIFVDINMPFIDGITWLKNVAQMSEDLKSRLKVVVATAYPISNNVYIPDLTVFPFVIGLLSRPFDFNEVERYVI